jgi:hypothetical protein
VNRVTVDFSAEKIRSRSFRKLTRDLAYSGRMAVISLISVLEKYTDMDEIDFVWRVGDLVEIEVE